MTVLSTNKTLLYKIQTHVTDCMVTGNCFTDIHNQRNITTVPWAFFIAVWFKLS